MADKIKQRRDTQDNWEAVNPILASGELGWITDRYTGKLGDGIHGFNDLPIIHAKMDEWINVEDFGAVGDGITDDTEAFQAISDYVNAKGYGVINFGYNKVYRLGRQTFTGVADGRAYDSQPMLYFENCNLLIINGNGSTLKLNDGLHYGSFDPVTGDVYNPPSGGFIDLNYAAIVGHIIDIHDSKNIQIYNLKIDGNNENLIIGGYWGDTGIQLRAVGIQIRGSSNVFLNNIESSYNGLDGLILSGKICTEDGVGADNILITNSKFDFNGRQGCSILGGKGIKFVNSIFSNTGRGAIASQPTSGVDIEPVSGCFAQEITFENCITENNNYVGMVALSGLSKNINLNNCEIWETDFGLMIDASNSYITNSKIHGHISGTNTTSVVENCIIDNKTHPVYGATATRDSSLLVNVDGYFKNCFINAENKRFIYTSKPVTFDSCVFSFKGDAANNDWMAIWSNASLYNCILKDEVTYTDKYFYYGGAKNLFNNINLGPNIKYSTWGDSGIIGVIPSNRDNVWEKGATRPTTPQTGQRFFDTTLGKPIWYNGTNWVDATGTIV